MNTEEESVMPFPVNPENGLSTAPMQVNSPENNPNLQPISPGYNYAIAPENVATSFPQGYTDPTSGIQGETFGNPQGQSTSPTNSSSYPDVGGLAASALNILPFLGPEGMIAKGIIGGGAGLLTGLLTHADQGQLAFDVGAGAIGGGAIGLLGKLIPASVRIAQAGNNMTKALTEGDTALDALGAPGKQLKLSNDITKEFGSPTSINEDLLPAATGAEWTNLIATLSHELTTIPGGSLGDLSLPYLQKLKTGYAAKAAFGDTNRSAAEKLYGNMSGAMGNVIKTNAPMYDKALAEYSEAIKDKDFQKSLPNVLQREGRLVWEAAVSNNILGDPVGKLLNMAQVTTPPVQGTPFSGSF